LETEAQFKLWLESARRGDLEAFGRIVAVLRPRLAGIVARYARMEQDREDLLQEVFIRAFRSLKKFRGAGSFEGWMRKIAVRTSIDWLRAKLRRKEKAESELSENERNWISSRFSDTSTGNPDQELQKNIAKEMLYKALDKLTPEDRTAVTLFELEGLSIVEIADITGWSISNVKVRCHRARNRLAKWVKNPGERP